MMRKSHILGMLVEAVMSKKTSSLPVDKGRLCKGGVNQQCSCLLLCCTMLLPPM